MIDETKQKAEDVNAHLLEVNKKMKRALDASGGASKWCLNIICIIILLSVVGYIYKMVSGG
jgi:t-SNARE complex subunit (syntaxin)